MDKKLLTRLGIAGLLIWVLLQGGYSLYKNYQHNKVKEHLAKVVEYANNYMLPQALEELETLTNMKEATTEEKNLAELLKKMIVELQNSPDKTAILNSLNDIVTQSNILEKDLIESAKKQKNSGKQKKLEIRKQSILKELDKLAQQDTSQMNSTEKYAYQAKKLTLLNELNTVMKQIQSADPSANDNTIENTVQDAHERKKQELFKNLRQLNQVNESKLTPQQRIAHRKKKQSILTQLENILEKDNRIGTPGQEARKREILQELKELHNKNESKLSPKQRQDLKKQRANLLQELENLTQQEKTLTPEQVQAIKSNNNEQEKLLAERKKQEQAAQQKLLAEQKKLEEEKRNLEKQKNLNTKQNQIEALKARAKSAFAQEDYNTALTLYNQLETLDPQSAETQAMKALIYSRLNKTAEAAQALQKAQTLSKGENIVDLARAEIAFASNDTHTANSLYAQILQKGESALALFRLGNTALRNNEIQTALDYYNRALKAHDYDILEKNFQVKLFHNAGQAYLMIQQIANAQKSFKSALKIDSDYVPSNIALGQSYYKQKNYGSASFYLGQAVEIDPKNFNALSLLGNSLHMQKNYAQAREAMLKALEIQPNNASLLYNLGSEEILLKNYPSAITHLESALKLQMNPNTKIQLGLALVRAKQNLPRAQQLFTEALSLNPKDLSALKGVIEIYDTQGQYTQALASIEQARIQYPNDNELLYKKGEVLFKLRRYPESIAIFRELLNLENNTENHFQLANVLLANNQTAEALTEYNTILGQKETPEYLEGRANALIKGNKLREAKTDLTLIITKYKNYPQINRVHQKLNSINRLLPAGS